MGLLDDLEPQKKTWPCKVRDTLSKLSDDDRAVLTAAIADQVKWPAKSLEKALKARQILLADTTITKHREGICSCSRD